MTSYRIDHAGITALAREWGIDGEIVIRRQRRAIDGNPCIRGLCSTRAWGWGAGYALRHTIYLRSDRAPEAVASTLAHELCHARQATEAVREHGLYAFKDRCEQELAHYGYDDAPFEREAREWGETKADEVFGRCFSIRVR